MSVEAMYADIILEHYKAKHHSGLREPYQAQVAHVNPTCGDEVLLRVALDGERVADVSYEGVGCSISQASTSVMSDLVIGKTVEEALALHAEFTEMMHSMGSAEPDEDRLEDAVLANRCGELFECGFLEDQARVLGVGLDPVERHVANAARPPALGGEKADDGWRKLAFLGEATRRVRAEVRPGQVR